MYRIRRIVIAAAVVALALGSFAVQAQEAGPERHAERHGQLMQRWADALELTEERRGRVRELLAEHHPRAERPQHRGARG